MNTNFFTIKINIKFYLTYEKIQLARIAMGSSTLPNNTVPVYKSSVRGSSPTVAF